MTTATRRRVCQQCGTRYDAQAERCPDCGTHTPQRTGRATSSRESDPWCAANGCPHAGTHSDGLTGGGPWLCNAHAAAPAARWQEVTHRTRQYGALWRAVIAAQAAADAGDEQAAWQISAGIDACVRWVRGEPLGAWQWRLNAAYWRLVTTGTLSSTAPRVVAVQTMTREQARAALRLSVRPHPRQWARDLKAREEAGELLSLIQRRYWREALDAAPPDPVEESEDEREARIEREAIMAESAGQGPQA